MDLKLIDIHTHIIPFVDDGSKSIEESLQMIKKMVEDGVTDVIATPHFQSVATKSTLEEQYERFVELNNKVIEESLNIKLHFGHEVRFISHLRPVYKNLTLANSKYLLIEFSYVNNPIIDEVIFNLKALDLKPIIAHVERYRYLNEDDIEYLRRIGAFIQVNAETIYKPDNRKEKKFINNLLKKELIDFIASDVHNNNGRSSNLRKAYDYLKGKISDEYLETIFYKNAKKIIDTK